jgi:hypothetical protein
MLCGVSTSRMWGRVGLVKTDVSEERSGYNESASEEPLQC